MDDFHEQVIERLERIEATLTLLVTQRTLKEWYSTAEVAELVGKAEYTVREWCRLGRVKAKKTPNGRGWLIAHEELTRLRKLGLGPAEHERHRLLDGRGD